MGWKIILILLSGLLTNNIGFAEEQKETVEETAKPTLKEVYQKSLGIETPDEIKYVQDNLKESRHLGFVKPYIPVMEQPSVKKVWIPSHASEESSDVLVGGHWVYIMLEAPRWFIETEQNEKVEIPVIIPTVPENEKGK